MSINSTNKNTVKYLYLAAALAWLISAIINIILIITGQYSGLLSLFLAIPQLGLSIFFFISYWKLKNIKDLTDDKTDE